MFFVRYRPAGAREPRETGERHNARRRATRDPGSRAREKTWRPGGDCPEWAIDRTPAEKCLCRAACGPDLGGPRPGHDFRARGLKSGHVVASDGAPARYRAGAPSSLESAGRGGPPPGLISLAPPVRLRSPRSSLPRLAQCRGAGLRSRTVQVRVLGRGPSCRCGGRQHCAARSPKPRDPGAAPGRRAISKCLRVPIPRAVCKTVGPKRAGKPAARSVTAGTHHLVQPSFSTKTPP